MKQAPVSTILAQPLGASPIPKANLAGVVKGLKPPPKTSAVLQVPVATTPQEILEVEGEQSAGASSGVERAMLAQSAAITSLVAHLATSSGDPLSVLLMGRLLAERVLQEGPNCRPSWPATMAASSMR